VPPSAPIEEPLQSPDDSPRASSDERTLHGGSGLQAAIASFSSRDEDCSMVA
jgi:hypothetical protein